MRIIHILPADTYTDGMTYKDNFLAKINIEHGHESVILTSCRTWVKTKVVYVDECEYTNDFGVKIIRRKYLRIFNKYVSEKLRILKGVSDVLYKFKPDVIRVLNPHNLTVLIVARYIRKNPQVKFFIDSHQEFYNSATNFFSYHIFHKMIIRLSLRLIDKYVYKYFYVLEGTKEFLKEMYKLSDDKLEYFPMGGIIYSELERLKFRKEIRSELRIDNESIVYIHTGKLFKSKKTSDILKAFNRFSNQNSHLIIIGSIPEETRDDLESRLNNSKRVHYLGWKESNEIYKYLNASDIYLQPGSASATLFQALTSGCILVVSKEIAGYEKLNQHNNVFFVSNYEELCQFFKDVSDSIYDIERYRINSLKVAQKYNYMELSKKLYE